jgi:hypothetical protein
MVSSKKVIVTKLCLTKDQIMRLREASAYNSVRFTSNPKLDKITRFAL